MPENEPVAYWERNEIACAEHFTPFYVIYNDLEPVYSGEVHEHELSNACVVCGKTIPVTPWRE